MAISTNCSNAINPIRRLVRDDMWHRGSFGLSLLITSIRVSAAEPQPVGIVLVGEDAHRLGSLQSLVEQTLAAMPAVAAIDRQHIAAALAGAVTAPASDPVRAQVTLLIEQGKSAYYDARFSESADRFALASVMQDSVDTTSAADRIALLLWRATLAVALGQASQAEAFCRSALALDPELVVDVAVYPPSLNDLLGTVKSRLGPATWLQVFAEPNTADVRIDQRPVRERILLGDGTHRLEAGGPGVRSVAFDFVTPLASLTVSLPPQLSAYWERRVDDAVLAAGTESQERLVSLRRAVGCDCLLLGALHSDRLRVRLDCGARSAHTEVDARGAGLAAWLQAQWSAPAPAAEVESVAAAEVSEPPATAFNLSLALGGVWWMERGLEDDRALGGTNLHAAFDADLRRWPLRLHMDAGWLSFVPSRTEVVVAGDPTRSLVHGGNRYEGAFGAAFVQHGAIDRAWWLGLRASLAMHQRHAAAPPRLFRSLTRFTPALWAGLESELTRLADEPLSTGADVSASPWSWLWERPNRLSGKLQAPILSGRTAVFLVYGATWRVRLNLYAEVTRERFTGPALILSEPLLENIERTDWLVGADAALELNY